MNFVGRWAITSYNGSNCWINGRYQLHIVTVLFITDNDQSHFTHLPQSLDGIWNIIAEFVKGCPDFAELFLYSQLLFCRLSLTSFTDFELHRSKLWVFRFFWRYDLTRIILNYLATVSLHPKHNDRNPSCAWHLYKLSMKKTINCNALF